MTDCSTLDGSRLSAFRDWSAAADWIDKPWPRLRVLHHADLRRIGAYSRPGARDPREWQVVGRDDPIFVTPGDGGWERPLDDPHISRRQLRVRYLPEHNRFEVAPHPDGKRRLGVWVPGDGIHDLLGAEEVPPGSAIAIEGRALVGLDLARSATTKEERVPRAGLVGESEATWRLREEIANAARFGHSVLVLGETGSGKELVAQAIRRQSERGQQPLVAVNCAALPEALAEGLLFGHVKGAFTGAGASQEGYFRAAHGGTLFLDELGEMPLAVQPKLLRALESGQVTPVGRHDAVLVDVRVIAATNRDPQEAISSGRLREDLYHRLAGHVIRVPSLTARRFDIPELFVAFMSSLRRERGGPDLDRLFHGDPGGPVTLPLPLVRWLLEQPWTGNVRELRNLAELCARKSAGGGTVQAPRSTAFAPPVAASVSARASAAALDPRITPSPESPALGSRREHLLALASRVLGLAHKTVAKLFDDAALDALMSDPVGLDHRLETAAAERLLAALERHDFEQRVLAAELNLSPVTLVKLMQRFRIPRALDLEAAAVNAALDATGGDLQAAARSLRVSAQGLKKRLIWLRLRR